MSAVIQRSFAGGELGPALWARAEQVKYQTGLRTCRNFMVQRFGGVTNRPGTRFVCEVSDSTKAHRLISFVFNAEQTYVLAFGRHTMRVIRQGAQLESSPTVPYELATPYAEHELRAISHAQTADVVTMAHRAHQPQHLVRTGHTAWTIGAINFVPTQARPTACAGTPGAAGSNVYRYQITAVNEDYSESLPGLQAPKTITGATQANPCVITAVAHGFENGEDVRIDGIVGMTGLNGKAYRIANKTSDAFQLQGVDSTLFTAYTSGGTASRTSVRVVGAAPTSGAPHVLTWTAPAGAWRYNIYKESAGIFGYVGTSEVAEFKDTNFTPATNFTPPAERAIFDGPGRYPAVCGSHQQRAAFANTDDDPERIWLSRIGQFTDFTTSLPIQSDDAVSFILSGNQVNAVRHLIGLGRLLALTGGSEFAINGDAAGTIRPTEINARQQGYSGAAATPAPVAIGNSTLYVQARGSVVRDLRFTYESEGYAGRDLTVFAPHLFDGHQIVAWAFQQIPHSVMWAVRDDGALLGLTYLPEHEVWGWHRHDTGMDAGDQVEDVAVVPEGNEDAVYLLVRRHIDGTWKRYIERLTDRRVVDIADACFLDCALSYDGRNTGATTLTLSGGTAWDETESLTLTASASRFLAGDVGNAYVLTFGADDIWCEVIAYTSSTVVTVRPDREVPAGLRTTATTAWARAVDEVAGLDHLEGRTVGILADGHVLPPAVVAAGAVTLNHTAIRITAGLPIEAEIETLDLENTEATLTEKRKRINRVTLLIESSRGLLAGPDREHLREYKQRAAEAYGEPIRLRTGQAEIPITSTWTAGGSLVIRQSDPLPLSILAITAGGEIGG